MKMIKRMCRCLFPLLLATLVGCASAPKTTKLRFVWPDPPAEPKLEYIGAYGGVNDMVEKSFMTAIVGLEEGVTLQHPTAAVADGGGKVFVSDFLAGLVEFDFTANTVKVIGGSLIGNLSRLSGIALDAEGHIYVGDMGKPQIAVFSKEGRDIGMLQIPGAKSANLFALDRERKRLIVPDPLGHEVHIVDLTGKLIKTIRTFRNGDGFTQPNAVAVDQKGNILVADTMNARIVIFTPDGEYLSHFGERGDGIADFNLIKGVAVDSEGHIYVADAKSDKIMIFSDKGDPLLVIGWHDTTKNMIGGFSIPLGISIDRNDRIYVVDRMNKRFQIYQYLNSAYLAKNPITSETELAKPLPGVAGKPEGKPAVK